MSFPPVREATNCASTLCGISGPGRTSVVTLAGGLALGMGGGSRVGGGGRGGEGDGDGQGTVTVRFELRHSFCGSAATGTTRHGLSQRVIGSRMPENVRAVGVSAMA